MRVIVSSRFAVEVVDLETGDIEQIRSNDYDYLYYGITWLGGYMFLAKRDLARGNKTFIEVLDRDFLHVAEIHLPEVKDVHQILAYNGKIWVTSTGTNQILIYDRNLFFLESWSPIPEKTGDDYNHFNSLWFNPGGVDGRAFVLAHNGGASQAYIYDMPGRAFMSSLDMGLGSHNIYYRKDEEVLVLSSGNGYVVSSAGRVYNLFRNSYPRGLAIGPKYFVVGRSEHVTDREDRQREKKGAVQLYSGNIGVHQHLRTYELGNGMILEIRGLDFYDDAHNGVAWTGKHGVGK